LKPLVTAALPETTPRTKNTPRADTTDSRPATTNISESVDTKFGANIRMKISCECDMLQSNLAYHEGLFDTCRAACLRAMSTYSEIKKNLFEDTALDCSSVELGILFWLRCRIMLMKCDIAQGLFASAIELSQVALNEASIANEYTFSRDIKLLRIHALVYQGNRSDAETECTQFAAEFSEVDMDPSINKV